MKKLLTLLLAVALIAALGGCVVIDDPALNDKIEAISSEVENATNKIGEAIEESGIVEDVQAAIEGLTSARSPSAKEPIDADTFRAAMTELGYALVDSDPVPEMGIVEMISLDDYSLTFYQMDSEDSAIAGFNEQTSALSMPFDEDEAAESGTETNVSTGSYHYYKLAFSDHDIVVVRYGSTLVSGYGDSARIEQLLTAIGY